MLNAANHVLIPTQPQYLSVKGIELLLNTIANVRENLNPNLSIAGSLITMFDSRLNFHKEVLKTLTEGYGNYFKIFDTKIPVSVRMTESQAIGKCIFDFDASSKVAQAYDAFAKELLNCE
jgi:chromosome partitioning protein